MLLEIERLAKSYHKPQYTVAYITFIRNPFVPNSKSKGHQISPSVRYSWGDVKNYICDRVPRMVCMCDYNNPCANCIHDLSVDKQKMMDFINLHYKKEGSCFIDLSNCGWSVVKLPG